MKRSFVMIATLVALPAVAQVYKCPDASGRTVIQQTPCAGDGGTALNVKPASGIGSNSTNNASREINQAIATGKPLAGMTTTQLNSAMGLADKVNTSMVNGVRHEQAIFRKPTATWYVYTENGIVTSVQNVEGPPIGAGAQSSGMRCPTAHEVRSLEITATSMTATRADKERYQNARNCR